MSDRKYETSAEASRFRWILANPAVALALLQSLPPAEWRDAIAQRMKDDNFKRVRARAEGRAFRLAQREQRRANSTKG